MRLFKSPVYLALTCIAATAFLSAPDVAFASDKIWSGARSTLWSDSGNWQGGAVPVAGDSVIVPPGAPVVLANDMGPISLDHISFQGAAQGTLTEVNRDGTITLSGSVQNLNGIITIPLVFTSPNVTINLGAYNDIAQAWTFSGGTATINSSAGETIFQAPINETARTSLVISASQWDGQTPVNTTGDFSLDAGNSINQIHFDASALGKGASPAVIYAHVLFITSQVSGPITRALDLRTHTSLLFTFQTPDKPSIYSGTLTLTTPVTLWATKGRVTGQITGPGRLTVAGLSEVTLSNGTNNFTGGTETQGVLTLDVANAVPSTGDLYANVGTVNINAPQTVTRFRCSGLVQFTVGVVVHATQSVELSLCSLTFPGTSGPGTFPQTIELVANDGKSGVVGAFAGLSELAAVALDAFGNTRYITYHGNDGNDIVLLPTPSAPPLVRNIAFDQSLYKVEPSSTFQVTVTLTDGSNTPVAGEAIRLGASCPQTTTVQTSPCLDITSLSTVNTNGLGQASFTLKSELVNGLAAITATDQSAGTGMTTVNAWILPAVGYQDMWWAGSAQNGWGVSIIQHADTLFAILYVYDNLGHPTWYTMPGGSWNGARTAYTGNLYSPKGSPFYAYDTSRFVAGDRVGTATLTFTSGDTATLDYSLGFLSGRKSLSRELFGDTTGAHGARGDMWWGGSSQNGWGVSILQQGPVIFPIWFTYDANGNPIWYVMPVGTWATPDEFDAHAYRTASTD